jgi:hypothetical protein
MGGGGETDRTGADDGDGEIRCRELWYLQMRIHGTTSLSRANRTHGLNRKLTIFDESVSIARLGLRSPPMSLALY